MGESVLSLVGKTWMCVLIVVHSSYHVTSQNQGGTAVCFSNSDLPAPISGCVANNKRASFTADWRCVGTIC
jgi:hypothetical protein